MAYDISDFEPAPLATAKAPDLSDYEVAPRPQFDLSDFEPAPKDTQHTDEVARKAQGELEDFYKDGATDNKYSELLKKADPNALSPAVGEPFTLSNPAINSFEDFTKAYTDPLLNLPKPTGPGVGAGVVRGTETAVEGLTSPLNIALAGLLPGAPSVVQKGAAALFGAQLIKSIPDHISEGNDAKTPGDKAQAYTEAALNGLMAALALGHVTGRVTELPKFRQTDTQQEKITEAVKLAPEPAPNAEISDTVLDGLVQSKEAATKAEEASPEDGAVKTLNPQLERQLSNVPEERIKESRKRVASNSAKPDTEIAPATAEVVDKLKSDSETADAITKEPAYAGGPGAMGPVEAEEMSGQQKTTSIKNAVVDQGRADAELPEREQPLKRAFGAVWDNAKRIIDANPEKGRELVDELLKKARPLTDTEDAILTHEQLERQAAYDNAVEHVNSAEDPATKAEAQSALQSAREDMYAIYDVGQKAGTENARGLNARRMMVREDYSLAKVEARARAANNGEPLNDKQLAELKTAHEKISELEKKIQEAEAKGKDDAAKHYFDQLLGETKRDVRDSIKKGKSVTDFISDQAEKARQRIRERGTRFTAGIDPVDLVDHAIIGADYIAKGVTKLADWSVEMVKDFGEKIRPYLDEIFEKSQQYHDAHQKLFEKGKPKSERTPEEIAKSIDPAAALDHATVYDLARAHVRAGVEGFDNVMKAVHEDLKTALPKITEREVRDAFSEYGKVKFPSKEADKVKLAEYRRIGQLVSAIEDAQKNVAPKKSGLQRDKPTQAIREKMAALREAMDKAGIETRTPEQQLASRNQARATSLRNQIEDLDKQLRTGEKPAAGKPVADSPEVETLRSQRDAMKSELKRIEEESNPSKSPEQKQLESLRARADELRKRIAEGDTSTKTGKPTVDTKEVADARSELKSLNDQLREMRKKSEPGTTPEEIEAEKAQRGVDAAASALDRWDRILKGELEADKSKTPEARSELQESMRAEVDAMKAAYREIKNAERPKSDAEAMRQKAQIAALEKSISEYERRTKEADFSSASKRQGADTEAVAKVRAARDAAKKVYDDLKKSTNPPRTPDEIRLDAYKTRLRSATQDINKRLSENNYAKPQKTPLTLDPEALSLKTERDRVKMKIDSKIAEIAAKNRTPSQKFWDAFVGVQRAFKLSSDVVLAKLSIAALAREAVLTPAEEAVGGVLSKALPKLAERAPREGGLSLRAEIAAKRALFTKGMQDAWNNLQMKKSDLEVQYGKRKAEAPPAWYEYLGFLHGALKAPVKRAEFSRSLEKRMMSATKAGENLNDPNVMLRLSQESYVDANRAIFMQDNLLSKMFNAGVATAEKSKTHPNIGPAAARLARFFVPIVKVPSNIVGEVATGVHGTITGGVRAAKAYFDGIEDLPKDQGDDIMRQLKKGLIGNALLLFGYLSYKSVGGFYRKDDKRSSGDPQPGYYRLHGTDLPPVFGHSPAAMLLNIGATIHHSEESRVKGQRTGLAGGIVSGTSGLAKELPLVPTVSSIAEALDSDHGMQKFIHGMITSTAVPALSQHIAKMKDTPGTFPENMMKPANKRSPQTNLQAVEVGIPGLREKVPHPKSNR